MTADDLLTRLRGRLTDANMANGGIPFVVVAALVYVAGFIFGFLTTFVLLAWRSHRSRYGR